ncbi:hypothetical protein ACFLYY_00125 [Patescibacteria group bacterium]
MLYILKNKKTNKGFAALFLSILILIIILGIGLGIASSVLNERIILNNITKSSQSYYSAESGIEDALYRLIKNKNWQNVYGFQIEDSWVTTTISDAVGGTRLLVSEGDTSERIRKLQIVLEISADKISFYYGAQIGDGGMIMGNNSVVQGNVFSNGSVTGGGEIENDIIVANNGNFIDGLNIGGNAIVHTCKNSTIEGTLTYVSGGSLENCDASGTIDSQPNEIDPQDLPITQEQITKWKAGAIRGGVINDDVVYSDTVSAGPVQIGTSADPKNLTLENNTILTVYGTIYVTGNIILGNGSKIELADSYGSLSGMIIADGKIDINNGVILDGSGQEGSYVLILSTNNSVDPSSPAIDVKNTAIGAIFYTNSGMINLGQNITAREITGYKVRIEENATIEYESGLVNSSFSGGTGGSWDITLWKEIE